MATSTEERTARDTEIVDLRRKGWSQRELAVKFGVSQATVSGVLKSAGLPRSYCSRVRVA